MKREGLCNTCDNSEHCVLTQENKVLDCEEFINNSAVKEDKKALRNKQLRFGGNAPSEYLQD
jgi:hypothetical protein